MAKRSGHQADSFDAENTGGFLTGFLAEEENVDRRFLLKLGTWGLASVGAVVIAMMANQSSLGLRRDQVASSDLSRQMQQMQLAHRESLNETRRLASAIDTLNSDRDRLFQRVATLELGLDSATGTIARQGPATALSALPAIPVAPAVSGAPANPVTPNTAAPPTEPQPTPQAANPAPAVAQVATVAAPAASTPDKKHLAATVAAPASGPVPATAPTTITATTSATPAAPATEPAPSTVSSISLAPPESPKETVKETSKEVAKDAATKPAAAATATAAPTPAPLVASKSMMAPPDPAATKLTEPSTKPAVVSTPIPEAVASVEDSDAVKPVAVPHTEFAIDLGTANSLGGLRALWRGLLKSNSALGALRPIVMVKESNTGFGMQLRLAAGPLSDAATAAKICAILTESDRTCETTVFDGQRLAMKADESPANKPLKPAQQRRRAYPKRAEAEEPVTPKPEPTTFSSLFGRR